MNSSKTIYKPTPDAHSPSYAIVAPHSGWRSSIDASRVSDANYFNDFGGSFELSSLTHLEQRVDLSHASNNLDSRHQFRIQVQRFQTINETVATSSRPYQRLPQITFDTTIALPAGLSLELDSELVNFERQDSITGERLNVQPRISLPLEAPYGFLTPRSVAGTLTTVLRALTITQILLVAMSRFSRWTPGCYLTVLHRAACKHWNPASFISTYPLRTNLIFRYLIPAPSISVSPNYFRKTVSRVLIVLTTPIN